MGSVNGPHDPGANLLLYHITAVAVAIAAAVVDGHTVVYMIPSIRRALEEAKNTHSLEGHN